MRWRRWVVGLGLFGLGVVGVTLAGGFGFTIWLGTPAGNHWLERRIEQAVTATMAEGAFEIDGLDTNVLYDLEIDGLRIVDGTGAPLVELGPSKARYNAGTLLHGPLVVHQLDATGLALVLDAGPDGRMKLADLFGPPSGSTEPFQLPIDFDVRALTLEGARVRKDAAVDVRGVVAEGALRTDGPVFDLSDLALCAHVLVPGPTVACAEGPVSWDGALATLTGAAITAPGSEIAVSGTAGAESLDLALAVGSVDLAALDPLASHVGIAGTWGGEVAVKGPTETLAITGRLAGIGESRGSLVVDGRAGVGDTITWGGDIDALDFHVEDAYPAAGRPVVLDGRVGLDATGIRFPDDLALGITYGGKAVVEDLYILENTDAVARIEHGVLTIEKGAFFGIAGQLDATGTIDLVSGPLALKVKGTVDPAEIAELGIDGIGGTGTADLTLTGDIKHDLGRFGVGGRVVMAPFTYTGNVRFERMVADLRGEVVGSDFTFDVDATGTDGVAYALAIGTLEASDVRVTSRNKDLQAVGPAHLESLRYPNLGWFETADAQFDFRLPKVGEMAVDAGIELGAYDLQTFPGSGGKATVGLIGSRVRYDAMLDAWGRELMASAGAYDLASARLEADFLRVAPTARLAWKSEGGVSLTVVEGGVHDAKLAMRGLHGDFVVKGDLATQGPVDGAVRVTALQLDALAELFPDVFPGVAGLLDLDAVVSGDASDPVVTGDTDVKGFWMEDVARWLDLAGHFELREGEVATRLDIGSAGEPLAVLDGTIPVVSNLASPGLDPNADVDVALTLKPGPLDRLEHVTPKELGLGAGRISAQVDVSGRLGDPDLRLSGIVETAVGGWDDPGRVEVDIRRRASDIDGWASLREGLSDRVHVTGGGTTRMEQVFDAVFAGAEMPDTSDLALWIDNMAVSAVLNGLPAESVMRASQVGLAARGELVGGFTASGSPWTPEIAGGVHWFSPGLGNESLEGAYLTLVPAEQGLVVDASLDFPTGGITVSGPLPIQIDLREDYAEWARGELGLEIAGEGVPLGLLSVVDRGIVDAEGLAAIRGTVTGTFDDPDPDLVASISGGALTYTPVGLRLSNVEADVEAGQRRVKLTRFQANTAPLNQTGFIDERRGSAVRVSGATNLERGFPTEMSARVLFDDTWVLGLFDASARLKGELLVSGAWPNLHVKSPKDDLELVYGRIIYNAASAEVAGPLQPSERIVIHRGGEQRRSEPVIELPFYSGFDVDLNLDLKRNLEVIAAIPFIDQLGSITANLTRANVSSRLGGEIDVALDPSGNPLLEGEVEVVDGSVQLLRTQFRLDEGRVVFLGGDVGNTQVDVTGSTSIEGTPVELRITGTADEPQLKTTAPGYDETQLLVMLLTGRSPDSLRGDASRAATQEAQAIAGTAAALVASSLLSGAATGALTIEPDGGIRIGAPWSSTVLTQLVLKPLADPDENLVAFSLEWALARRLLLELGAGTTYQWTDLSWETRF
ncbi:MAG: translocation/assembly module TamB domain-containing protein [Alphaproteobacteria bacterium]|nr:translocation/assembly module TamB domain-containing protein [Alphaproteobacteria bacterium]